MRFELAYAGRTQPILIPDRNLLGILEPNRPKPVQDVEKALGRTVEQAADFLGSCKRVLVLVNDRTRPTPSKLLLSALTPALRKKAVRILLCLGAHRFATPSELNEIVNPELLSIADLAIIQHNCRSNPDLELLGRTTRGTEVRLNREVLHTERIIAINSVEPHYFAGFTGGRKSFMPGVASHDAIRHNHSLAASPAAVVLKLDGNPVHEDMAEAADMVPRPVFSIQVVEDRSHHLLSIRSGKLRDSFLAGCADASTLYSLRIHDRADIVLSVLQPPGDINFYQSQRAVEFAIPALTSPSVHITVSCCKEGIGDDNFIRILQGCRNPNEILDGPADSGRPGWHKAVRLARIMQRTELFAVTGIDPQVIRSVFMTPFTTVQGAIDTAIARFGPSARVYVIPDAAAVVPVCFQ
ncbi:MAG: nickel-dependent lactate racemase [candidate division WOR-3 bacterium]